jgi:hypothetical protein
LWLSSPDSEFGPEHKIYAQGRSAKVLKPVLRLRGPSGAQDEFLLAVTAQNLRKLAKRILPTEPQMV